MSFQVERRDPASVGLDRDALDVWLARTGPVAIVDLETTGLPDSRSAEIIEIGVVLLEPGTTTIGLAQTAALVMIAMAFAVLRRRTPIAN